MLTMILSVVWFGHRLSGMQWVGVGLVFGGVGAEGWIQRREKAAKEKERKRRERERGREGEEMKDRGIKSQRLRDNSISAYRNRLVH